MFFKHTIYEIWLRNCYFHILAFRVDIFIFILCDILWQDQW